MFIFLTAIGTSVIDDVDIMLSEKLRANINSVNNGHFGNFNTINYKIDIPDELASLWRRNFIKEMSEEFPNYSILQPIGDWYRFFIVKKQLV